MAFRLLLSIPSLLATMSLQFAICHDQEIVGIEAYTCFGCCKELITDNTSISLMTYGNQDEIVNQVFWDDRFSRPFNYILTISGVESKLPSRCKIIGILGKGNVVLFHCIVEFKELDYTVKFYEGAHFSDSEACKMDVKSSFYDSRSHFEISDTVEKLLKLEKSNIFLKLVETADKKSKDLINKAISHTKVFMKLKTEMISLCPDIEFDQYQDIFSRCISFIVAYSMKQRIFFNMFECQLSLSNSHITDLNSKLEDLFLVRIKTETIKIINNLQKVIEEDKGEDKKKLLDFRCIIERFNEFNDKWGDYILKSAVEIMNSFRSLHKQKEDLKVSLMSTESPSSEVLKSSDSKGISRFWIKHLINLIGYCEVIRQFLVEKKLMIYDLEKVQDTSFKETLQDDFTHFTLFFNLSLIFSKRKSPNNLHLLTKWGIFQNQTIQEIVRNLEEFEKASQNEGTVTQDTSSELTLKSTKLKDCLAAWREIKVKCDEKRIITLKDLVTYYSTLEDTLQESGPPPSKRHCP